MLVRFNIKNFLSFEERSVTNTSEKFSHEFSMLPGKVHQKAEHIFSDKKQSLLRFAAIYGANASGKSNIVKAFRFFQSSVASGKFPVGSSEKYCKIKKSNKSKPSYFEVEVLLDDELYAYGFEGILSEGVVVSEWLTKLSKKSETNLFYKDGKNDKYHFESYFADNSALDVYQQGIEGSNTLFLNEMNNNKQGFYAKYPDMIILRKIYKWITEQFEIIHPMSATKEASFLINSTSLAKVAELLNSFDTGILSVTEINEDPQKVFETIPVQIRNELQGKIEFISSLYKNNSNGMALGKCSVLIRNRSDILGFEIDSNLKIKAFSVQFLHQNVDTDIHFKIAEESDGTARLFELIEILLSDKEKTYVVDELDRCLHPCLTYQFVRNFFEYTEHKKVQLIITTHESRLMDFNLLRRDEIWFIDKDKGGNSSIYSLEEYNTRFDQKIDKAYLEGRYGGVPVFTTVFPIGEQNERK